MADTLGVAGIDHQAARWWPPLPQPEVLENLFAHVRVGDHGDQPHLAAAATAYENVFPPHPAEKIGPGETASALGIVGAGQVVGRRRWRTRRTLINSGP